MPSLAESRPPPSALSMILEMFESMFPAPFTAGIFSSIVDYIY